MSTPPNLAAVTTFLVKEGVAFTDSDSDEGWELVVLSEIEGKALDDLVKLVDTQQNVVIRVTPNLGMTITTERQA